MHRFQQSNCMSVVESKNDDAALWITSQLRGPTRIRSIAGLCADTLAQHRTFRLSIFPRMRGS
jgi:hypothetical protein